MTDEEIKLINKKIKRKAFAIALFIWVIVIAGIGFISSINFAPEAREPEIATCKVCDRQFQSRDNVKSIHRTNMCKNCYENFQWRLKVQEEIDDYNLNHK